MQEAKVQVDINLWTHCPYCDETIDLMDIDDDECIYSEPIFTNRWEDLEGEEVYCHKCEEYFAIQEAEY